MYYICSFLELANTLDCFRSCNKINSTAAGFGVPVFELDEDEGIANFQVKMMHDFDGKTSSWWCHSAVIFTFSDGRLYHFRRFLTMQGVHVGGGKQVFRVKYCT